MAKAEEYGGLHSYVLSYWITYGAACRSLLCKMIGLTRGEATLRKALLQKQLRLLQRGLPMLLTATTSKGRVRYS